MKIKDKLIIVTCYYESQSYYNLFSMKNALNILRLVFINWMFGSIAYHLILLFR